VLTIGLLLPGCWISGWFSEAKPPSTEVFEDLPNEIPALLELANEQIGKARSMEALIRAVAALDKAGRLLGEQPSVIEQSEISIKMAIACFLVSEMEVDVASRLKWIAKGENAAQAAVTSRPNRVEGYYYLAVLKGRRAEQGGLSAIAQVKDIEELGLKAKALDQTFEEGGPLRLLAMLYAKAPPWPTSVGDIDLALEYAQEAIEVSDYPLNHLILAEVLIEAGEAGPAKEEIHKVLSAPKVGKWASEGELWRPHARQLLRLLK
jgi:hypothetical protein